MFSGNTNGFQWNYEYNGYEYDVTTSTYDGELTWYEARAECLSEGGDLASIGSVAEDNFINTIVSDWSIIRVTLTMIQGKYSVFMLYLV